jgi:sensor histidine kinase YesM
MLIFTREHIFNSMGARQIYVAGNIMHEGDVLGITAIGIDERYLAAIINKHCAIDNHSIYILNDERHLIFEGYYNYLSYDSISRQITGLETLVDGERDVVIDGERFLVVNHKLDISGINNSLNVVALIPQSEIYKDIDQLNLITIILFGFMSLVMIIIILFIRRTIISPIISLSRLMSQIEQGNFTVQARVDKSDEIGQLCRQFNYMTDSLNQYIKRIVYEEEQKRKVEFNFLQAQIRPHFIRNTLSIIKWMADIRGADGISKAITSFISILEYNFRSSDLLKSIREEFDFLEQYIFLQKIRYQGRFVFQTQIDPDILDLYILKMTLQPIIENCVMNGLSGKKGTMTILVKGFRDAGKVVFVVEDDGVGISPDKLSKILSEIDKGELNVSIKKTGLINVFNRLNTYFGQECSFSIISEPGNGTCVRMVFPTITRKEDQDAIEDHAR